MGSVSAEAKILPGSKISGRSDVSSFPVVSESGKVRISSPDICGGEVADVRPGSHGEAVPIFLVIDYAPVLYDRHEPFDVVIKVLPQVYPIADVGSVTGDLSETLDAENENDGQYRDGHENLDERKAFLISLFNETAVFFEKEMEEGRNAPSGGYAGRTFPVMFRSGNEHEIEKLEKAIFGKGFPRFSDEGSQ